MALDEVEFKRAYDQAFRELQRGDSGAAMMLILQLLNGLNERITELQGESDEC